MSNNKTNPIEFFKFLSRFFDKGFEISDESLSMAEKFLFDGVKHADLEKRPDLLCTLNYLKNIRERNKLGNDLNDLIQYYDKKRNRVSELFTKLEETDPEECLAVKFQQACKTYMKVIEVDDISKEWLYYPLHPGDSVAVDFNDITYRDSIEEEIQHLARIKGNLLNQQKSVYCASSERINELNSN